MRRILSITLAAAAVFTTTPGAGAQPRGAPPVVFVHGMGASAAEVGVAINGRPGSFQTLLEAIAEAHPRPDVCARPPGPARTWKGSPCVFSYVEDKAQTDAGPNDSQSAVRPNADKLAREVAALARQAGRRVVLVGYSMGGAIIRTYLAHHREGAERDVDAVVLIDAVASGSWGYAFAGEVPRRVGGGLGERISELMRSMAASSAAVDFSRPATRDLRPRSDLFREIAPMPLPRSLSYYTFWGDIRVSVGRNLLHYPLPSFDLPSLGDLGLLPGDPDPEALPELGGQRFTPAVDPGQAALDVPHRTRIRLDAAVVGGLLRSCGRPGRSRACAALAREHLDVPNSHTAIPLTLDHVDVEVPELGGRITLLEAIMAAIGRHR